MRRLAVTFCGALLLLALFHSTLTAQGVWSNGQDALLVVGQPDLNSGTAGTTRLTLDTPRDVALDRLHGKLYVVDRGNHRILRYPYPLSGSQPVPDLVLGQPNFTTRTSSTGSTTFDTPIAAAIDASGRLWVADYNNNRVVWFDAAHTLTTNQPPADGVLGQPGFVTNISGTSAAALYFPWDLTLDDRGGLYVADGGNNRVLYFEEAAGKTPGGAADRVFGQLDFSSGGAAISQSGMDSPRGVALDGRSLFVADRNNARVLRFDDIDGKNSGAPADGVLGQSDFNTRVLTTTVSGMGQVGKVVVDGDGRLYVSDGLSNDRILIFNQAAVKPNGAPADFVLGQPDFTTAGGGIGPNRLSLDTGGGGLAIDPLANLLFVADDNNNRVVIFHADGRLGHGLFLPALFEN